MAGESTGRRTVAAVGRHAEELEGRVLTAEAEIAHLGEQVANLARTVGEGFRETREMFEAGQRRFEERTVEVYKRLEETNTRMLARSQVSWPLVVSVIVAALAIGGVFAGFVTMTTHPMTTDILNIEAKMAQDDIRERDDRGIMSRYDERFVTISGSIDALKQHVADTSANNTKERAAISTRFDDLRAELRDDMTVMDKRLQQEFGPRLDCVDQAVRVLERKTSATEACLERMHDLYDLYWPQFLTNAKDHGRLDALVAGLRDAYDALAAKNTTAGPLGDRITELEKYLRKPCPTKDAAQ